MNAEQVEKIFNLIEPFLPKQTVIDFKKFMNEFNELQELSYYNLTVIERQRHTIDHFSQKARLHSEKVKELEKDAAMLTEYRKKCEIILYEEQKKQHTLAEELLMLQKEITELNELLQNEVDKNYQFAESVMKMAADNRVMIANNKKLVEENKVLIQKNKLLADENEMIEDQYNVLVTDYEQLQENIQREYGRGFQNAHFHHRRKR